MISAIIQARMGSRRLPQKVLLKFPPYETILEAVISRVKQSKVDKVVVTTPDRFLIGYIERAGADWQLWEGKRDVLAEYYWAAKQHKAKTIVRITADCPLVRPDIIDLVIDAHLRTKVDFTFNRCDDKPNNWPDGFDVEVFTFKALKKAYLNSEQREHVGIAVRETCKRVCRVNRKKDYGKCTSVDTRKDYEKALQLNGG